MMGKRQGPHRAVDPDHDALGIADARTMLANSDTLPTPDMLARRTLPLQTNHCFPYHLSVPLSKAVFSDH